MMNKPKLKKTAYYDYNECRNYLQEKYNYDERDYAGQFKKTKNGKIIERDDSKPYLDFWLWVCDNHEIHNDCFITFTEEELAKIKEDWVKEIYTHYLKEFAKNGELELFCWW